MASPKRSELNRIWNYSTAYLGRMTPGSPGKCHGPGAVHNCLALFVVKIRSLRYLYFFGARTDLDLLIGFFTILSEICFLFC